MSEAARDTLAVVKPDEAPVLEGNTFISLIERVVCDPNISIDRVERVVSLHERMQEKQAKSAYLAAFSDMQPALPVVERNGTIMTNEKTNGVKTGNQIKQSKYAKWEDISEAATPVLSKHGFSLSFRTEQPTPDRVVVTAVLGHREGHEERTSFALPIDTSGSKNNVQGWGSSLSYAKRYTGTAILNIVSRGEDDDGAAAGAGPTITEEQLLLLRDKMDSVETSEAQFCKYLRVQKLSELPANCYQRAITALNGKGQHA